MTEYLQLWKNNYIKELTEDILPFWLKNGLDRVNRSEERRVGKEC